MMVMLAVVLGRLGESSFQAEAGVVVDDADAGSCGGQGRRVDRS